MSAFLDWLNQQKGRIGAVIFFAVILGTLWGKLVLVWKMETYLREIRDDVSELKNRDNAIDFGYRNAICSMIEMRNEDCEYFKGATIILVAPEGAAQP